MSGIRFGNFGTGKYNFGYIPDPPEPPSDSWFEEHCPKCKNNREWCKDGKWENCNEDNPDNMIFRCSVCGYEGMTEYYNFCPNCGADMRGDK